MRLIKIKNDLINEDKFIGIFWEDNSRAVVKYHGADGKVVSRTLAKGNDWREAMRDAAHDMLFDLEKEDQEE